MSTINDIDKMKIDKAEDVLEYVKKGFGMLGLLFLKNDAKRAVEKMISEPDSTLTKKIFNMTDEGLTKRMLSFIMPHIKYSEKVFIPRQMGYISRKNLENILSSPQNINLDDTIK